MTLPDDPTHSWSTKPFDHSTDTKPTWPPHVLNTTIPSYADNDSFNDEDLGNFEYSPDITILYHTVVPIMLVFCLLSVVINLAIVASVHWIRHTMTPTQCLSMSLAVADAYASLIIGLGLLINSLLPIVYKIHLGAYFACGALTLEALRMAGMMSSVLNLLALAINHYVGILRPLHYASTITRRNTMLSITLMWIVPLLLFFIYFSSLTGRAYQSDYCRDFNFLGEYTYRIVIGMIFFIPLLLMAMVYGHIFVIVRQHHKGILQNQNRNQLNRNVKAIHTTLLILGTYLVGWMPAVIFFLMTCFDCRFSFTKIPGKTLVSLTFTFNTLIIIKSLLDPIIYAARMKEIRKALVRMRRALFCQTSVRRISRSRRDDNGSSVRSRTDTTGSIRLQSTYGYRERPTPVLIYQTKELVKENGC